MNMGDVGQTSASRPARPYRSPRRQEQARRTRQRILAAARAEFLASGYAGTTMRAVATAAGVALPTLELSVGTKGRLLKEVIDVAIAGDDQPVPVLDRPWAAEAEAAGTVEDFLRRVAAVLVPAQERSARLVVVALEAADADPALAPVGRQLLEQRTTTAAWVTDGIARRTALRAGIDRDHAVDTVWLLMDPVVFCRLTADRGWGAERYGRWFVDGLQRLLLP